MSSDDYDLVIIGGGSAGLTAAGLAARLGARVAIIDRQRLGGDCTWSGCVPSKTLLKTASVAHQMRHAGRYGLAAAPVEVDLAPVMAHVREVIDGVYRHETPEALRAEGIDVFLGGARFIDEHTIAAGDATVTAGRFLIAVGARPLVPPISGLAEAGYLTYETVWDLEELPRRLVVAGGGPIGCEMAQAFSRLGSEVTLIEGAGRLLLHDEPAASEVIAEVFAAEGIDLRLNTQLESAWRSDGRMEMVAGGQKLDADALLVAFGRRPVLDELELEKAGVTYDANGIKVDQQLRTSRRHIYAAGDCTGGPQFTHYAGWQAAVAVRNALIPGTSRGIAEVVPWTTFTDPEVAHVGLSEEEARRRHGDKVMVCDWPMADVDRARAEGDTTGFLKLVHLRNGRLLGVTIVAARAGETIHEWVVALACGMKVGDLADVIHVYPTYSTAAMQAAADIRVSRLLQGVSGKVVRGLVRLMR